VNNNNDDDEGSALQQERPSQRFKNTAQRVLKERPQMDAGPAKAADPVDVDVSVALSAAASANPIDVDEPPAVTTDEEKERRLAALRMLADKPISAVHQDLLGFAAYADALAALINNPNTATPLTLAVNARWGNGKSSLGRLVKERLADQTAAQGDRPHLPIWFNAWMHDDAGSLATAFVADVVHKLDPERPLWHRIARPLPIALAPPSERPMMRLKYAGVVLAGFMIATFVGFAATGFDEAIFARVVPGAAEASLPQAGWIDRVFPGLGLLVSVLLAVGRPLSEAARAVRDFVKNPGLTASSGSMERVRKQLGRMIHAATPRGSRLVIFVDDLDRVRPPAAVELLEAANQLMSHEDVVVVLMADLPAIAAQAEIKYAALASKFAMDAALARPDGETAQSYGRQYLQKIVQLQFDLPPQSAERMKAFLQDVAVWSEAEPIEQHRFGRMRGILSWPMGTVRTMAERRRRRRLRALAWDELSSSGDPITAAPSSTLLSESGEHDALLWEVWEEQRNLKIENDSALLNEALEEAFRHLPPSPRNAKRVLNRLRLLLHLARARGLLGAGSVLTPAHIGHWAVLQERWPELIRAVTADPARLNALESTARSSDLESSRQDSFDALVKELVPRYGSVPALLDCLARGERLGDVAAALVSFEPALLPQRKSARATVSTEVRAGV
jgi:hypothetical protein